MFELGQMSPETMKKAFSKRIDELALKIKRLAGEQIVYWSKDAIQTSRPWDLPDAIRYVAIYYGLEAPEEKFSEKRIELQDWQILSKLEAKKLQKNRNQTVSLKVFKDDFLKNMPQPKSSTIDPLQKSFSSNWSAKQRKKASMSRTKKPMTSWNQRSSLQRKKPLIRTVKKSSLL